MPRAEVDLVRQELDPAAELVQGVGGGGLHVVKPAKEITAVASGHWCSAAVPEHHSSVMGSNVTRMPMIVMAPLRRSG